MSKILAWLFPAKQKKKFNPKEANLQEFEKQLEEAAAIKCGNIHDFRKKYWGHNVEYLISRYPGLVHCASIWSSKKIREGDIVIDDFNKGTAKLIVIHSEQQRDPADQFLVYMGIVSYLSEEEIDFLKLAAPKPKGFILE